ncbi:MAG: 2,3-bisphosphoglycerate-independent phosphoglycerate mutase [Planctomyces sp.]
MMNNGPLVLVIRDGWGMNPHPQHDAFNAVKLASQRGLTPVADRLMREYPWTLIKTSGEDVGIPDGTMGNSEVGHQNIGAGRVVDQESVAITKACRPPRGLHENAVVAKAITRTIGRTRADGTPSVVHLLCICSDAGVHGQLEHLFAMVRACKVLGQSHVAVHLITDGRDTGPYTGGGPDGAGGGFVERVERELVAIGVGRVQSVMGRYFAMDRDNRWERVQLAYECLVGGNATPEFDTAAEAMRHAYANPPAPTMAGDEFVTPCRIGTMEQWQPMLVRDGDSVVFVNYRGDRPRELSAAFAFPDDLWAKVKPSPDSGRHGFDRGRKLDLHYVIMTEYWDALLPHVAGVIFPKPPKMRKILGEHISALGLTQFRCAETEKYPHVTFFFNDYREEPYPGEQRQNPQSPKVATYDLKPEMSADHVRDAVLARLAAPDCQDVIVVNFANGDMVGHTGSLEAAIKACAAVDACVGQVVKATLERGGQLIVTADHGNAEQMFDPETNAPHTAHTTYDVPMILVSERLRNAWLRGDQDASGWFSPAGRAQRGRLGDIAPTLLHMGNLPVPPEMEGTSLIVG